jgi:hypothetical protein
MMGIRQAANEAISKHTKKQSRPTRSPGVGHARSLRRTPRGHEEGRDSHHLSGSSVLERTRHRVLSPRRRRTASQAPQGKAQDGQAASREGRPPTAGGFQKKFAGRVRELSRPEPDKPLKVLAFDEARFGLINCTGGVSVRRAFAHPTSSAAPTSGPTSTRQSNPQWEKASAFIFRG